MFNCLLVCYLPDNETVGMEDYIEKDREVMNQPQDISNMNISVSNIDPIRLNPQSDEPVDS